MIRKANINDLEKLVRMAKCFSATGAFPMGFNYDHAKTFTEKLLENENAVVLVNEDATAMIGGLINPWMLNFNCKMLCELAFWVDEDKRHTGIAKALITGFIQEGKNRNANVVSLSCLEKSNPDNIEIFYNKLGLDKFERTFLMEI